MTFPIRRSTLVRALAAVSLAAAGSPALACSADSAYLGTVCTFAFNYCPQGFLPADGRLLPVQSYAALFALVGTTFGGDGRTTFGLPDLRGRAAIGLGQGPGLAAISYGQQVGQQQTTLASSQVPLVTHTHGATFTPTTGTQQVPIPATTGNLSVSASLPVSTAVGNVTGTTSALANGQSGYLAGVSGSSGLNQITFRGPFNTSAPAAGSTASLPATVQVSGNASTAATTVDITTVNGGNVALAPAGQPATTPVSTQSPAVGLTMCIVVNGLFPSRP